MNKNSLKENERIDDLEFKNLKIIQNPKTFCFGIDSILLSDFAKHIKKDSKVIDLGTGNGILPLLLSKKTFLKEIYGIEVQKDIANMAERSVQLNSLDDKIKILNVNIKDVFLKKILEKNKYDVVVTNPPYKEKGTGIVNEADEKIIARHEVKAELSDFLEVASCLLKDKGEFYMVHRANRLVDIIEKMRKFKIEPKEIRMVHSKIDKMASMILIKGIKGAKKEVLVREPLIIYNKDGKYNKEIYEIYNKKEK